jgi:hypothetical protein
MSDLMLMLMLLLLFVKRQLLKWTILENLFDRSDRSGSWWAKVLGRGRSAWTAA